jgi:hypothetical protein
MCTTRSQSEALLKLGLKKETADMVLCEPFDYEKRKYSDGYTKIVLEEGEDFCKDDIPAWSLHRLIELNLDTDLPSAYEGIEGQKNIYDEVIDYTEWLIKEGYFNKEYLV